MYSLSGLHHSSNKETSSPAGTATDGNTIKKIKHNVWNHTNKSKKSSENFVFCGKCRNCQQLYNWIVADVLNISTFIFLSCIHFPGVSNNDIWDFSFQWLKCREYILKLTADVILIPSTSFFRQMNIFNSSLFVSLKVIYFV